jgi:beta-galactosidase
MNEAEPKGVVTRRSFLKTTSSVVVGGAVLGSLRVDASAFSESHDLQTQDANGSYSQRLLGGWEHHRGGLGGVWEAWRKTTDDAVWQPIEMPHCFNAYDAVDPDTTYYQGPGWYRSKLKIDNPYPNGRTLLHFEGAGQKTQVYVYTEKAGAHTGGYDEFVIDITDQAERYFKNTKAPDAADKGLLPIAVMCDNSRDLEMIPSNLADFNLYGGLYRYLNLVYVPPVSIRYLHVIGSLDPDGKAQVSVQVRLYNPAGVDTAVQLEVRVVDPAGKVVHSSSKSLQPTSEDQAITDFTVTNPVLWSPANPSLYRCEVELKSANGEQRSSTRFGLRSFEFVKQGPFKLNGERLLLRGTQRHEDHAGLGAALTESLNRREFTLIKEMGANFVRLAHYQQSRVVLDLCDELGLMVWEEIPWCRGGLGGPDYQEQARRMLRNMIDQHRNHPAIIIWGLGNENDWPGDSLEFDKAKIRAFMTELNTLAHQLDPTRRTAIRRCEFCSDIVDVYSPSIWAGWYSGRYTEYKTKSETEMKKVNHFLHAEWGGDSHARRHAEAPDQVLAQFVAGHDPDQKGAEYLLTGGVTKASSDGDWSETYICNLFDWHLKEQETMGWLTGAAQWIFKDFSTPGRPKNPVPNLNQKGVVERDLTIKEGYYVFQSYWADRPMVHIYGHSWPIRWGATDESKLVKIYSNCPRVELFVNGVSAGVRQRDSQNFPAAGLRWLVKFKEGANHLKAVAGKNGSEIADQVSFVYQTQPWGKPERLELEKVGVENDVITVRAQLLDARGTLCLDARNVVRFGITGEGRLLDNLGTSTGARRVELANGRALIRVQRKGESVVSVAAEGVATKFLSL